MLMHRHVWEVVQQMDVTAISVGSAGGRPEAFAAGQPMVFDELAPPTRAPPLRLPPLVGKGWPFHGKRKRPASPGRSRLSPEIRFPEPAMIQEGVRMTVLKLTHSTSVLYPLAGAAAVDLSAPLPVVVLVAGVLVLAGFAAGITFEQFNLRVRERQLARGRRLLADQARGLRRQVADTYRMRADGQAPDRDATGVDETTLGKEG